jgi:uncharacterized membrane protein
MLKERLLAYTDAVIAIIITIMVLELKPPHEATRHVLYDMRHIFLAYVLSFMYLTIYRHNHHHMFQPIKKITSATLRWNSLLLFALSLVPFSTAWMAENHFASLTVILYGIILLASAAWYYYVSLTLKASEWPDSAFAKALNKDRKWKTSLLLYILGTIASFRYPMIWLVIFFGVALMWLIPDKRMEKALELLDTIE